MGTEPGLIGADVAWETETGGDRRQPESSGSERAGGARLCQECAGLAGESERLGATRISLLVPGGPLKPGGSGGTPPSFHLNSSFSSLFTLANQAK